MGHIYLFLEDDENCTESPFILFLFVCDFFIILLG